MPGFAGDYLEAVYVVNQEKIHVRIRDICKELGIKPPTVVEMVKKLSEQGYLIHKKNEGVYLTPKGEEIGRTIKDRHSTISAFLTFIGVSKEIANEDACVFEAFCREEMCSSEERGSKERRLGKSL